MTSPVTAFFVIFAGAAFFGIAMTTIALLYPHGFRG